MAELYLGITPCLNRVLILGINIYILEGYSNKGRKRVNNPDNVYKRKRLNTGCFTFNTQHTICYHCL
jgi:hypothetical protein